MAALAAGADAVYCGLQTFSARMAAPNFTMDELAVLAELARQKGTRVFAAVNTLLKPGELESALRRIDELKRSVKPDAIIFQDPAILHLVHMVEYSGELILSTLSPATFPAAIEMLRSGFPGLPTISGVVLPRELTVDEIRETAAACGNDFHVEVFVHGALCYGVSGRCYWSSFLGGKSGLRGRCVQPCRRRYNRENRRERFFSCLDLSLDVLCKVLIDIPRVRTWKIEGRKKGPHYVYYTTAAYKLLRDHPKDAKARQAAVKLLESALGRKAVHYHFLPQKRINPTADNRQTASGMLIGHVKNRLLRPFLTPKKALYAGDLIRVGYDDQPGHTVIRVGKAVPRGGRLAIHLPREFAGPPARDDKQPPKRHSSAKAGGKGPTGSPGGETVPVFLVDRREPEMVREIEAFTPQLEEITRRTYPFVSYLRLKPPKGYAGKASKLIREVNVHRKLKSGDRRWKEGGRLGAWLDEETVSSLPDARVPKIWWWLPPVIWPAEQSTYKKWITSVSNRGGRYFVLNQLWQTAFFPEKPLESGWKLWAGPFCNLANPLAIRAAAALGFTGAFVSPELDGETLLHLPKQSVLPLGIVLQGRWPLCLSRIEPAGGAPEKSFQSPKKETAWYRVYDGTVWVYPNWQIDLTHKREALIQAGYRLFAGLYEPLPQAVSERERAGLWNWDLPLY